MRLLQNITRYPKSSLLNKSICYVCQSWKVIQAASPICVLIYSLSKDCDCTIMVFEVKGLGNRAMYKNFC